VGWVRQAHRARPPAIAGWHFQNDGNLAQARADCRDVPEKRRDDLQTFTDVAAGEKKRRYQRPMRKNAVNTGKRDIIVTQVV
jgi:hypothetical protein